MLLTLPPSQVGKLVSWKGIAMWCSRGGYDVMSGKRRWGGWDVCKWECYILCGVLCAVLRLKCAVNIQLLLLLLLQLLLLLLLLLQLPLIIIIIIITVVVVIIISIVRDVSVCMCRTLLSGHSSNAAMLKGQWSCCVLSSRVAMAPTRFHQVRFQTDLYNADKSNMISAMLFPCA